MGVKPFPLGAEGPAALVPVQALLVGAQLGQGELLALKIHQGAGIQVLVPAHQGVVLLHQFQHPVVGTPHGQVQDGEQDITVPAGKGLLVGAGQAGPVKSQLGVAHPRAVLVKEIIFPVIERIPGINGMPDLGQAGHLAVGFVLFFMFLPQSQQSLAVRGLAHPAGQFPVFCQQGGNIRPMIGKFGKFHGKTS